MLISPENDSDFLRSLAGWGAVTPGTHSWLPILPHPHPSCVAERGVGRPEAQKRKKQTDSVLVETLGRRRTDGVRT